MLRTLVLLGGLCVCAYVPAWALAGGGSRSVAKERASAAQEHGGAAPRSGASSGIRSVGLKASFSPERLGAGTTLHLSFQVAAHGSTPVPLIGIELLYPNELGLATSDLGLESCSVSRLEASGLGGCPENSLMGHGSATVEVPLSGDAVAEKARVTVLAGPVENGHLGLLFYVNGGYPVIAELVFPGLVLPAQSPFGGVLDAKLPLVPSVPEGPDAAMVRLETELGPNKLIYHERVDGKLIAFRPTGILLPRSCPAGGFPFAVHLSFADGASSSASTTVPCPKKG